MRRDEDGTAEYKLMVGKANIAKYFLECFQALISCLVSFWVPFLFDVHFDDDHFNFSTTAWAIKVELSLWAFFFKANNYK